jgi:sugar phosphate isomerase/epimerase
MSARLCRRRFLAAASAASAAWLGAPRGLPAAGGNDGWGGFPVGVQTISLRKYTLPEALRQVQGLGVHHVEFSAGTHLPATASDAQISEARTLAERAGLKVSAQGVNRFSKDHAANRRIFEFARKLGIRTMTANPQRDAETFASLDKLVAEYDMRLAIHNHGPGTLYDRLDDVVKAIKDHDRRIGACVDCGHFFSSGEDPVRCVLTLGPRVYGVHLKDRAEIGRKSPDVVIGKGQLDVVGLFKALRRIGFPDDGALSLEYEANPDNPIGDMKACLAFINEAIARSA